MVLGDAEDSRSKGTARALACKEKKSFLPFLMDTVEKTGTEENASSSLSYNMDYS